MQDYMYEFYPTINRLFFLVCALINNIMRLLGIDKQPKQIKDVAVQLSPTEKYIETRKTAFLKTFQEEEDFNSNIDAVIRDPKTLAETLKNPDNEYEKLWKKRILIENTPRGNVFMFYDLYKRAFSYYCDQAVMPYDIMNAVAMKYVTVYRCRDFFIDSGVLPHTETNTEESPPPPQQEEIQKKTVTFDKNAFAKFKSYNSATQKTAVQKEKTINCFLHLGGTRNWSPITKKTKQNPINGFKTDMVPSNAKLSYSDYKRGKVI